MSKASPYHKDKAFKKGYTAAKEGYRCNPSDVWSLFNGMSDEKELERDYSKGYAKGERERQLQNARKK